MVIKIKKNINSNGNNTNIFNFIYIDGFMPNANETIRVVYGKLEMESTNFEKS